MGRRWVLGLQTPIYMLNRIIWFQVVTGVLLMKQPRKLLIYWQNNKPGCVMLFIKIT